jgi:hypothetical protein
VRTVFSGELWLSYAQMYVETDEFADLNADEDADLAAAFAGQRNGLCGAVVPGRLWLITGLHTGTVPLTVQVHDEGVPPVEDGWEEVVEVSFTPAGMPVRLLGCMGDFAAQFVLGPGVSYRVRYCGSGLDAGRAADTRGEDEPVIDRYLLQFWPAPPAPDVVVRCSSEIAVYWHGYARDLPSPRQRAAARAVAVRALDPAAAQALRQQQEERERRRRQDENLLWRGRRPEGPVADIAQAGELARYDRPLIDALADAPAGVLQQVASRAARWALTEAGMTDIDWIAGGLAALEAGRGMPAPFDDDTQVAEAEDGHARDGRRRSA